MPVSNEDLFMAILSMDSYNRGYNPGIAISGTQIGNATFTLGSDQPAAGLPEGVAAGFYAAAYDTQWGTVISYRGTDINDGLPSADDVLNGWQIGGGSYTASQFALSTEFLETVAGGRDALANITLTGHSLGGGLAA
jgi:Lipase (class 3)